MDWNEEVQRGKRRRALRRNPFARELEERKYTPRVIQNPYKRERIRKEDINEDDFDDIRSFTSAGDWRDR
jgi:hypothetical protein